MVRQLKYWNLFVILMAISLGVFILSCAPKARKAVGEMDTPSHHTSSGTRLLDQGKYADAAQEFDLALGLDARYSQAHTGMGQAKASQGDFTAAFDSMKLAKRYAEKKEDKVAAYVGYIRLYTMNKAADKNWLSHAVEAYQDALGVDPAAPAVYYFMGRAYKEALDFQQAGQMFVRVLELKGDYVGQADREWSLVQKIQRAMQGQKQARR
jgi:tetratricopeptide (TPR) repeat protein